MRQIEKQISSDDMKRIELDLMERIHKVCEQHNLVYFLGYGSCIGAVRHQGIIPWDDDIDIVMPYPDYRRLLVVLSEENQGRYRLLSMQTDNNYKYPFAKYVDTYTVLTENNVKDSNIGVYIDIFPLCGLPNRKAQRHLFFQKINFIELLAIVARINKLTGKTQKHKLIQLLLWPISKLIGVNVLNKNTIYSMGKYDYEKSNTVAVLPPNYGKRELFAKTMLNERILSEFEGRKFYIPKMFDYYLRQLYGDYLKFPPEEERVTHHIYNVKVRHEDN